MALEPGHAHHHRQTRITGIACGGAIVFLFSGFMLVSRAGFASPLKLIDMAALRFSIGGLVMLPVLLRHGFAGVRLRGAAALAFCGGLGFVLCAYAGLMLAPASHGTVLVHGALPLFTFVLTWRASPARAGGRHAVGLLAIVLGIAAMACDSIAAGLSRQLLGDAALLLASVCWAAYGVLARRQGLAPAHTAAIVAVLSMACYLPVYAALPGKAILLAGWREVLLQAVFQGVLLGAVSAFVYARAVAALGAQATALFTAAVPCVTTAAAFLMLGEVPSTWVLCGVLAVTAGMVMSMRYR
jgi:drug/metabolite transporter (DMT)-like permease